jgi:hypothetical protein
VTDLPYTDADLRAEAARQLAIFVKSPSLPAIGALMRSGPIPSRPDGHWGDLEPADFNTAQHAVSDLIGGAADTSEWAIQLGAAGLNPHPAAAWKCVTSGWEVAIQVATAPDLTDAATAELLTEIHAAVEEIVRRVLGLKPA